MGKITLPIYQPARKIQPQDLLCLVHGESRISMAGFAIDKAPPMPFMQGAPNLIANLNHEDLLIELRSQAKKSRRVLFFAIFSASFVMLIGLFVWSNSNQREISLAPIEWSVQSIGARTVTVSSGNTLIEVPVGSKMPNGDTLLTTSSPTASYTTNAGTMRLTAINGK